MTLDTALFTPAPPRSRWTFDAIGTGWAIETDRPLDGRARDVVARVVEDYDRIWSRFRDDSVVSGLAERGGSADLGPTAPAVLGILLELAKRTDGAVTPLIGRSLEHLGYDAGYRLGAPRPGFRAAPTADTLQLDGTRVTLTQPALIDIGAAGKGQLVDLVLDALVEVLDGRGNHDVLVDAGGDLRTVGAPVRVALEHPYDPTMAIGVLEIADGALAASAVNRRSWDAPDGRGRLHHVLDGRTGRPVQEVAATWALADTALVADALATALFFVPPADLAGLSAPLRCIRMFTDGRLETTGDLPGELFR